MELFGRTAPLIMGIVNCTPDSFFSGSRNPSPDQAVETALRMVEEGADILDLGGESSRPGSDYVSAEEELARIIAVVKGIRGQSTIPITVDTRKRAVAEAAVAAGADGINDISALQDDPDLAVFAAEKGLPVILMHKQGAPSTMQVKPGYEDCFNEVCFALEESIRQAVDAGINRDNIIVDPGIGFGKRQQDNLVLLRRLSELKQRLNLPVLIGLSRKSFLGKITGKEVEDRLAASLAAHVLSLLNGADILRVHDVAETCDALKVVKELAWTG